MSRRKWSWIILTAVLVFWLAPLPLQAALPPRVVWEYSSPGQFVGFLSFTSQGTLLVTENGPQEPKVRELSRKGEVLWEFGPVQANSAVALANGHVLIADSGAPGYPFKPRLVEVDRQGQVRWSYEFDHRGHSPRLAVPVAGERYLVVLPDRVVEMDRKGKVYWQYEGLLYPVWAERLPGGNTLIVDRGFYGGLVLEVDPAGRVVWRYGDYGAPGQPALLSRPGWATRLPDGSTLVVDQGRGSLLRIAGAEAEVVNQWTDVLGAVPVTDRWLALPEANGERVYLSLTLSGGRSVLWLVDREIRTLLGGEPVTLQVPPLMLEEGLYGGARELVGLLGGEIEWHGDTRELEIRCRGRQALVQVDSSLGLVDGEPVTLAPPKILSGTTMVPLDFLRDHFGLEYRWDPENWELDLWL